MIFNRLRGKRAIDASQFPFAELQSPTTHSGVSVDQDSALALGAVYSCIRINAETPASLPWDAFRIQGEDRIPVARPASWLTQPNPEVTPFEFRQRIGASLETDGNAYIQITALDDLGYPKELWNLHPSDTEPKRDGTKLYFEWQGQKRLAPWDPVRPAVGQVLHIKGFSNGTDKGLSPIDLARESIGLGLVTEKFGSRFFGSGQTPSGVIELRQGVNPSEEFKNTIRETWVRRQGGSDRSHLPAILVGAEWKPITISPEHAQFLETRKFQVTEIARWFGLPPHFIGDVEKSTSWGTGIEQQFIGWVTLGLQPRVTRVEQALTTLVPRGQVIKINLMGLLRGDQKSRYESYAIALQNKWMVPNEVRHLEERNSVEWGDEPIETANPTGGATS